MMDLAPPAGEGLVDLHSHVLPGLDDGPNDVETAVQLVLGLEQLGFTDIYPTPHQKSGAWIPTPQEREEATRALKVGLGEVDSEVTIHTPAGENMWDEIFLQRQPDRSYPTYPGGKAFLVEFQPDALPPHVDEQLFQFRIHGQLPVLAHVERYAALARDHKRLEAVGRRTALLVNLTTLGGSQGFWASRLARKLVREGLVHGIATDAHGLADLPSCRAGLAWLDARLGQPEVIRLLRDNPRRIVAGELPE